MLRHCNYRDYRPKRLVFLLLPVLLLLLLYSLVSAAASFLFISSICVYAEFKSPQTTLPPPSKPEDAIVKEACGDLNDNDDEDDEMEQEEMFVDAHDSFRYKTIQEWGGPRRGGRLPEPTRYGDWERKGRCSDF